MKNNRKGFTLAELLIVVAIIAVLVAVAIPVFTAQLEKSREATDLSNIRAAYAECSASLLSGASATTSGVYYTAASGDTPAMAKKSISLTQTQVGWQTSDGQDDADKVIISGQKLGSLTVSSPSARQTVTIVVYEAPVGGKTWDLLAGNVAGGTTEG